MQRDNASNGRWAVAAYFFVNGFVVGSWAPQIPLLVGRFSLTEGLLGLLILVLGIGAVVAMPLFGWLITRFGSRSVVRVAGVACAASFVGVAAAPTMPTLVTALVAFGSLMGAMDVAMNSNAVAVERRLGRAVMSSSHGFWSLGGFVGAGVGGLAAEQFGHLAHGVGATLFALALVLAAWPWLIVEEKTAVKGGGRFSGFPRSPAVYLTGLIALFSMVPEGAVLDWAALYLRQEMDSGLATASLAFTAFSGAMATMRFLGDGVRNRLGAVATMRLSGGVAALGMLGAALAPSPPVAIVAFALCGLGIANMVPIAFSAAGNQPGMSSAAGMSVATTIGYSGILVAPSFVGFIAEFTGFSPVFAGFAVLLIIVVAMSNLVRAADGIAPDGATPARSTG